MLREAFVQSCVETVVGDQFVMCSAFNDSAVIEHDDLIGIADGAEAMSDDERRATVEQYFQRVLKTRFRGTVDAAGGFIQHQN